MERLGEAMDIQDVRGLITEASPQEMMMTGQPPATPGGPAPSGPMTGQVPNMMTGSGGADVMKGGRMGG